jgi:hypothetical protein
MDALMIITLLTFTTIKDTNTVGISYEAKLGLTTMERCKLTEKVLAESPPEGKNVIVLCAPSKDKAPANAAPGAKKSTEA